MRGSARLVGLVAAIIVVLLSSCSALQRAAAPLPTPTRQSGKPAVANLPVKSAGYLGVYMTSSPASYAGITKFARAVGREPNIVEYYSGWGEAFQTGFAKEARSKGAVVLTDIEPTDVSLQKIAAGHYDHYLTSFASSVRAFRYPVIISFGHEMNGTWYSWGWKHTSPKAFVNAWRHVVTLFRRVGADNVTWLWTVNWITDGEGPIADWWPGANYVTWAAIDGYFYDPSFTFSKLFDTTIRTIRKLANKPILIAETAAGPVAGQSSKIPGLIAGVRREHLMGFVWFDADEFRPGNPYKQNWTLRGTGLENFRAAIRRDDAPAVIFSSGS